MTASKKPLIRLVAILILMIVADQVTKQMAQAALLDEVFHERTDMYPACGDEKEDRNRARFIGRHRTSVTIIEDFFELRYVENCASAFGLMSKVPESFRFPFFLVISLLAVAFIPYLFIKTPSDQKFMIYALPFILGGAIGNLIDRVVFRYVIDFVRWYVVIDGKPVDWPTFNVADAAIVVGIALMILQMFQKGKPSKGKPSQDKPGRSEPKTV